MAEYRNDPLEPYRYHLERLDDVRDRVSRIEGEMKSFATKEDVANAKVALIFLWVGAGAAILAAAVSLAGAILR